MALTHAHVHTYEKQSGERVQQYNARIEAIARRSQRPPDVAGDAGARGRRARGGGGYAGAAVTRGRRLRGGGGYAAGVWRPSTGRG